MTLEEIIAKAKEDNGAAIEAAIKSAWFGGIAEGRRIAKVEILNVLTTDEGVLENWKKVTAPSANEPDMFHEANANRSTDARVKRAPRGLTREVLARVFAENPKGLTMEATQDAAVALDERISRKTVYNEMYRETDTYFKDGDGVWHRRAEGRGGNAAWLTSHSEGGLQ